MAVERDIVEPALSGSYDRAALVTLVALEGSGYRRPGARMLVTSDGRSFGSVSGGCLEAAIVERAANAATKGELARFAVDTTRDTDALFGYGLGCAGRLLLHAEPFEAGAIPAPLSAGAETLRDRMTRTVTTRLDETLEGERHHVCVIGNGEIAPAAGLDETATHYTDVIEPPVQLVIFGAGNDARPLASLAASLGWDVVVVDHRGAYASPGRFPGATRFVRARPEQLDPSALRVDRRTGVVLATHNLLLDAGYLERLTGSRLQYAGVVGSRKRFRLLAAELGNTSAFRTLERIHSPAGLDIGAETPTEIALSIVGEVASVLSRTRERSRARAATPLDWESVEDVACRA